MIEPDPHPPAYQQFNNAEAGSSLYAVLHGGMHIRNGHPVYRIEPFPLTARETTESALTQPSRLLAVERRVVEFSGRQQELTELAAWRDSTEPGVSALLLYGPGGQGKTRLASPWTPPGPRTGRHRLIRPVCPPTSSTGNTTTGRAATTTAW